MTKSRSDIQISVVIPAYNVEAHIERAINSVLAQHHAAEEIIVVDDGSRDGTAEKIKAYGDKIRHLCQDNKGPSAARNTGIKAAKYPWIAFLDGDDEWLPHHIERQITILTNNPELKWSAGNFLCCLCQEDRRGVAVDPIRVKHLLNGKEYFDNYFYAQANGICGNSDTMMIHKDVFKKIGLFDEHLTLAEDTQLWWRIAFQFPRIGYAPDPCAVYHMRSSGTLTESFKASRYPQLMALLETNQRYAANQGMSRQFAPLVRFLVTSWIRGLLFENRPDEIRELLSKFGCSLSHSFRLGVVVLLLCPKGSAVMLHFISRCVRKAGFRKKMTRPPAPLKN